MSARQAAIAFLLLPGCAFAGLELIQSERGVERPVSALLEVGTAALGEPLDLRFRLRNTGAAAETVRTLAVSGNGYQLQGYPTLPYIVAPGAALDFTVRFAPAAPGYYTASIQFNHVAVLIRASAVAAASLSGDPGGGAFLAAGAELDFGRAESGSWVERRFALENRGSRVVEVRKVEVRGGAFLGPMDLALPLELAPGASASFRIAFVPTAARAEHGELEIDGRVFPLRGVGLAIPPPRPLLELSEPALASGAQGRLVVRLASPSRVPAAGEVTLDFRPAVAGTVRDPAIGFLPDGSRVAQFRVAEGDAQVGFDGRGALTFQTGTTAGTLVFKVRLGEYADELSLPVHPEPVRMELARGVRSGSQFELHVLGFDNTRSVSHMVFTFFDRNGQPVEPGAQRVDAAADFSRYFDSAAAGGAFLLRAVFSATGDAQKIAGADVEIINSLGTARSGRIVFD